jgi:hypothetical protein
MQAMAPFATAIGVKPVGWELQKNERAHAVLTSVYHRTKEEK